MSGPIQNKIINALRAGSHVQDSVALEIEVDNAKPTLENWALYEAQLELIKKQMVTASVAIDDVRTGNENWSDLIRKLGAAGGDEDQKYTAFQTKYKVVEAVEAIYIKLDGLQTLAGKVSAQGKILRLKADQEQRAAEITHAQALAAATAGANVNIAPNAQAPLGTIYALPTLQIRPFKGDRRNWPEFWESFRSAVHTKSAMMPKN